MSRIHVMSDNLANKISAGEVVERCSSVLKELVENSIDAKSSYIKVELVNGGLNGICVTDNGIGMEHDDALLSFQRHATSKLTKEDDLFFIDTLGFRGEALPSIASVSEVDMTTCASKIGTHISIKGGKLVTDEKTDSRIGTKIEVKNLFFNTPARLKYLKSEQTDLANCVAFIEKLALSYPKIKFTLLNNERVIVKTSGSGNLKKAIHEIYGLQISSKLIEVKASNDDYDIYGYICKPEILKSNRYHMTTIVNGRIVRNNELNKAINDAYYTYKPDIKFPIVVLNINTDPTLIDVNIHPTKQDIKLSKIQGLYDLIYNTLKDALYKNLLIPSALERITSTTDIIEKEELNKMIDEKITHEEEKAVSQTSFDFAIAEEEEKYNDDVVIENREIKKLKLKPIGSVLATYIIAQNEDGLYIIDQHAAHERVNYERFQKAMAESTIVTTPLLVPITIELSPTEFITVSKYVDFLKDMGIVLEEFGINTYIVKEHPTYFVKGYEEEGIRRVIDLVIAQGNKFDPLKFRENVTKQLACKMSIKANMQVSLEVMQRVLDDLVKCDNPYNCCHGRPTMIKFSTYDLERMFKRNMN